MIRPPQSLMWGKVARIGHKNPEYGLQMTFIKLGLVKVEKYEETSRRREYIAKICSGEV